MPLFAASFLLLLCAAVPAQEMATVDAPLSPKELQDALGLRFCKYRLLAPKRDATGISITEVVFDEDGVLLRRGRSTEWTGIEAGQDGYDVTITFHDGKVTVMVPGFQQVLDPRSWVATRHFVHDTNVLLPRPALGIQGIGHETVLEILEDGHRTRPTGKMHGIEIKLIRGEREEL